LKILVLADIHNDVENIFQYLDKAEKISFDMIICPGDFTDIPPKGFTKEEIGKVIIEALKSFNKPLLAVPGNWDETIIKLFEKEGMSVHGKGKLIENVGFYGFGGAKTPFNTSFEPDEKEIEKGLSKALREVKDAEYKVQITHNPPKGTKLDMLSSGMHVGSFVVRKFIEEVSPIAAVCAHIHEAKGTDIIGNTKIINPGRFPEGYCGVLEINQGKVDSKLVSLI